jgi:hypothetical protein
MTDTVDGTGHARTTGAAGTTGTGNTSGSGKDFSQCRFRIPVSASLDG